MQFPAGNGVEINRTGNLSSAYCCKRYTVSKCTVSVLVMLPSHFCFPVDEVYCVLMTCFLSRKPDPLAERADDRSVSTLLMQNGHRHSPLCSMDSWMYTDWLAVWTQLPSDPARGKGSPSVCFCPIRLEVQVGVDEHKSVYIHHSIGPLM